jgi:hypothetical protein
MRWQKKGGAQSVCLVRTCVFYMATCVRVCRDSVVTTHVDARQLAELHTRQAVHTEGMWLFFETDPPRSLQALEERHVVLGSAVLAAPVLVFKHKLGPCTLDEWAEWVEQRAGEESARVIQRFHLPLTFERLKQSAPSLWPHMMSAYGAKKDDAKRAVKARTCGGSARTQKRRAGKCVVTDAAEDGGEDENETLVDLGEDDDLMDDEEDDAGDVNAGEEDIDEGCADGAGVDDEDALQPAEDVFGDGDDAHAFDDGDDVDEDVLGSADSGSDDNVSLGEEEEDEQEAARAKKARRAT